MDGKIANERLLDVSNGKALFGIEELVAIYPEIAGETRVHELIATAVLVKRLVHGGHSSRRSRLAHSR
jgi:hypothetical protein